MNMIFLKATYQIVLIVAKCNVNLILLFFHLQNSYVLIVAKCNVNQYSDLKFEVIFEY